MAPASSLETSVELVPSTWRQQTTLRQADTEPSLHSRSFGDGPPIVFLHGAFTTHADWPPEILAPLSENRRIILVDRPGHGLSSRARFAASCRHQARLVKEGLKLDRPALLVGHSYAGSMALAFAEAYPELTAGLVLVSPLCLPETRLIEMAYLAPRAQPFVGPLLSAMLHPRLDDTFLRLVHAVMFAPQPIDQGWLQRYAFDQVYSPDAFLREGEDTLATSPFNPLAYVNLRRIRCPVRFVLGDRDLIVDHYRQALPAAALLLDARIVWARGLGHMVHVCEPHIVLEAIAHLGEDVFRTDVESEELRQ